MNKSMRFLLPFFLLGSTLFGVGGAGELTISRISVVAPQTTDARVIRDAFVELAVGDTVDEGTLNDAVSLIRDRLMALGYFGSVDLTVVHSKSKPGTVALVVEVTEGFRGRFGGGPMWARAGEANWEGTGRDFDLYLGLNRQSLRFADHLLGSRGWRYGGEIGNWPLLWLDSEGERQEDHWLGGSASVDRDWGWGWQSGLGLDAGTVLNADYGSPENQARPRAWLEWARTSAAFSPAQGGSVHFEANARQPGGLLEGRADFRGYLPVLGPLKSAFRAAGATQLGTPEERERLVLSGLDGVRKGFDPGDRGQTLAWVSAEVRWETVWNLGFTTLTAEPAVVADLGRVWDPAPGPLAWALGGALRLYFATPVLLPLRFELTTDQKNRLRFGFGATAPF